MSQILVKVRAFRGVDNDPFEREVAIRSLITLTQYTDRRHRLPLEPDTMKELVAAIRAFESLVYARNWFCARWPIGRVFLPSNASTWSLERVERACAVALEELHRIVRQMRNRHGSARTSESHRFQLRHELERLGKAMSFIAYIERQCAPLARQLSHDAA
jgi:hypothetical protein